MNEQAKPLRILRDRDTSAKSGIPRASRYQMMAAGEFPKGIPLKVVAASAGSSTSSTSGS